MEQIKKLAGDIDLDEVQRLNPTAYSNYMSNLQKQNENIRKMDEYAEFVNRERDRINREQLNMANVNSLNQLNSKQHKQALDYAHQKLREGKAPSLPSFDRGRDQDSRTGNRNNNPKQGMRMKANDSQFDDANRLLDNYSAGGDDPLADFMKNPSQRKKPQAEYDDEEEYDDGPVLKEENYRPTRTFNQFPQQYQQPSPYMPQQYPMQQQYGNPYQQQVQPQPFMPGYNMYPYPYPQIPNSNRNGMDKEKDNELKHSLEKQAMILENLGKTLENNLVKTEEKSPGSNRKHLDSREFEKRLQDYERESELKMLLARQAEKIEALERDRLDKDRGRSKQDTKHSFRDDLLKEQGRLLTNMMPNVLGNQYMQNLNPFQYNSSPHMMNMMQMMNPMMNPMAMNGQYMMNPMYAGGMMGFNTGLEPQQKKTVKKKKKTTKKGDEKNKEKEEKQDELPKEMKTRPSIYPAVSLRDKKPQRLLKLKSFLWTMAFPSLFLKDTTMKMVGIRQDILTSLDSVVQAHYEKLAVWMKDGMKIVIKSFDELKPESWDFTKNQDKKKPLKVKEGCLRLLKQLNAITTEDLIGQESLLFLGNISMDSVYIPSGLLSIYELNRLNFSPGLKRLLLKQNMGQIQTQMILTCTIVCRILIYSLLLKPWEAYPEFENKSPLMKTNLKLVASVIYQIAIGYFRQMVPLVDPQNYLHNEISPLAPLFADQDSLNNNQNLPYELDEVINSLFTVPALNSFLSNEANCKEIREGFQEWMHRLFVLVMNNWIATNQKVEELKQNPNDPQNQANLKIAHENPLLTGLAKRSLLNGYRNMTGTPGDNQIALQ